MIDLLREAMTKLPKVKEQALANAAGGNDVAAIDYLSISEFRPYSD